MAMEIPTFIILFFVVSTIAICCGHSSDSYSYVSVLASSEIPQFRHHNRHLLQAKSCTVDFQTQNYTIITSQCNGPPYSKEACCDSLIEFACPFAAEISDNSTNCAETMFSYINIYGNYSAGLFANLCVSNSSQGLPCPNNNSTSALPPSSNAPSDLFGTYSGHHRVLLWVALACTTILFFDMSVFFSNR